ncbi:MAG: hypothetical protein K2X27_00255 [Candidatus Obscuribacterales bacterium]|nr:hypothetical protein [Candidatus Obscuribacterales bacterium]
MQLILFGVEKFTIVLSLQRHAFTVITRGMDMNMNIPGLDQSTLPFSLSSLHALLDMVLAAGKTAVDMRAEVDISTKSGPEDLVTCADKKLSEILMAGLGREFPNDQIISEEHPFETTGAGSRRWFIDPIDGTKHYVNETGRWSVMVGLVDGDDPIFGIVYIPAKQTLYFGGPSCGSWSQKSGGEFKKLNLPVLDEGKFVRTLISKNDLAKNMWASSIPGIEILTASSIGLDMHEVLVSASDAFVHIRPTLKTWDTAAPAAISLGAGLEIGSERGFGFTYPHDHARHDYCVVIGRKGSVEWWQRSYELCPVAELAPGKAVQTPELVGCC